MPPNNRVVDPTYWTDLCHKNMVAACLNRLCRSQTTFLLGNTSGFLLNVWLDVELQYSRTDTQIILFHSFWAPSALGLVVALAAAFPWVGDIIKMKADIRVLLLWWKAQRLPINNQKERHWQNFCFCSWKESILLITWLSLLVSRTLDNKLIV